MLHSGTRSAIMHELGFVVRAALQRREFVGVALHELADVERGPLSRLMAVVQAVDPTRCRPTQRTEGDTGRDGMPGALRVPARPLVHRFSTWSPTQKHDPQHHRYLTAPARRRAERLRDPQSQRSLADVRGYLRLKSARLAPSWRCCLDDTRARCDMFAAHASLPPFCSPSPSSPW